jgi:hypothetical protein
MDAITSRTLRGGWSWTRIDWLIGAALLSSLIFIWLIAAPAFLPAGSAKHAAHLPLLYAHIAGGTVMLLAGAANLRIGLTRQGFRWHRAVGFSYMAGGSVASIAALIRSFDTAHTPGVSTGALSVVWLAFTAMAWRAIRNRRTEQHREWMIRSYVAAWTFVFCRFYSRAMPADLQGSEVDMIWLTWVGPVLLTEILLQWRRGGRASVPAPH